VLEKKQGEFESLVNKLKEDPERSPLIPNAINAILQDLIFEKFGIEEED
jgi:hypothetical protein